MTMVITIVIFLQALFSTDYSYSRDQGSVPGRIMNEALKNGSAYSRQGFQSLPLIWPHIASLTTVSNTSNMPPMIGNYLGLYIECLCSWVHVAGLVIRTARTTFGAFGPTFGIWGLSHP